jgi:hypothetical protein
MRAIRSWIIDVLFQGDLLLCCGKSNSEFATRSREEWRGTLAGQQLIMPSPMISRTGLTQDAKESEHCLANTGPRRFLVIEQDKGTIDEQAAILLHLAERAPLALAVHSGGKSIHGWFYCQGQPEERMRYFMRYAVTLGADPATWTRSQFVRMPDGTREWQPPNRLLPQPGGYQEMKPLVDEWPEISEAEHKKQSRDQYLERKAEAARIVNDSRPKIELPGANRLLSEFGAELASLLKPHGFYSKDGVVVTANADGNALEPVTGRAFRTSIERYVIPYSVVNTKSGFNLRFDRTLAREDSESLLVCPQFIEGLPRITAVNNVSLPIMRTRQNIELLPGGLRL